MKWASIIITILALLFLCIAGTIKQKNKKEAANVTIIKGRTKFLSGNIIDLYAYPDVFQKYLGKKIIVASCPVERNGRFLFSLNLHQSSAFDLKIGNRILASNLFLCPGDQITINSGDTALSPHITINANGGKNNQFLLLFNEKFFKESKAKRDYYINSNFLHADEYAGFLESRRQQQLKLYEEFFSASQPNKEFETYILSEINYQYATDKLLYLWKKGIKNKPVNTGNSYYEFLTKDFIENPEALNSPSYVHFLKLYFSNIYEQHLYKSPPPKNDEKTDQVFEKLKFAKENLSGLSLHIVTINILNDEVNSVDY